MRRTTSACLLLAALSLIASQSTAQTPLGTQLVANGFTKPLLVTAPAADARLFVVEQTGRIKIVSGGQVLPTPFLSLAGTVNGSSEQGLLGLAFDPNYAQTGYFYVNYTTGSGSGMTVVERYSVSANPDVADASSGVQVLQVNQPFTNHNAGMLAFDADGYLLIAFGDGGSANDPSCRAQDLSTWMGKLLRIDVSAGLPYLIPSDNPFLGVPGALPEIYQYGLRNPWRFSVDALTGDVYIGDVGQSAKEEISFYSNGQGGLNFGWKVMESIRCNTSSNCPPSTPPCNDPSLTLPIYDLPHSGFSGPLAITGGYVYRGAAIPDLQGTYFFADYSDDKIRTFTYDTTGGVQNFQDRTVELAPGGGLNLRSIASFGEDGFGELYLCDHSGGEVFKIVPNGVITISGVTPDPLDALVPGVDQVVSIAGDGFGPNSSVTFDGVSVDSTAVTFVSSQLLTLDPPQASTLGSVDVVVTEGGQSATGTVTIKAPDQPQLQLGDGVVPNVVSQATGLDLIVAGTPGRLHYVLYSSSNLPSVTGLVSLDIGNNFTDLFVVQAYLIPAAGWTSDNIPFTAPLFTVFYSQTVALGGGQPIEVSNLQQIIAGL